MRNELERAVYLRENGRAGEARELLLKLVAEKPDEPQVNYQCAWVHDLLGREHEAVPFYERAIEEGLTGEDLEGAMLGLGSTYRALGESILFYAGRQTKPGDKGGEVDPTISLGARCKNLEARPGRGSTAPAHSARVS